MPITSSRAAGADQPPSPAGTPRRRAPRRSLRTGLVVALLASVAVATVVAAEPAAAPDRTPVEEASAARATRPAAPQDEIATVGMIVRLVGAGVADDAPAAVPPTTTTTVPPTTAPPTTVAPPTTAAPAAAPVAPAGGDLSVWDRLARCESGGNWAINTGNGFYGGLQFSASSWRAVGGSGLPHQASRETQIAMGQRLQARQGWGAWPACSRKLGLR